MISPSEDIPRPSAEEEAVRQLLNRIAELLQSTDPDVAWQAVELARSDIPGAVKMIQEHLEHGRRWVELMALLSESDLLRLSKRGRQRPAWLAQQLLQWQAMLRGDSDGLASVSDHFLHHGAMSLMGVWAKRSSYNRAILAFLSATRDTPGANEPSLRAAFGNIASRDFLLRLQLDLLREVASVQFDDWASESDPFQAVGETCRRWHNLMQGCDSAFDGEVINGRDMAAALAAALSGLLGGSREGTRRPAPVEVALEVLLDTLVEKRPMPDAQRVARFGHGPPLAGDVDTVVHVRGRRYRVTISPEAGPRDRPQKPA